MSPISFTYRHKQNLRQQIQFFEDVLASFLAKVNRPRRHMAYVNKWNHCMAMESLRLSRKSAVYMLINNGPKIAGEPRNVNVPLKAIT